MPFTSQRYIKVQYAMTIGALLFLLLITWFNSSPPVFDEVLFVRNMPLFQKYGVSAKFLTEMYDQAPGPLYQIVQNFFSPLTHMLTPGIRLVNVFLFFLVIANTRFCIPAVPGREDQKMLLALNLVGVPVVWQVAGMALTEIPAMFFATLSLLLLYALTQRQIKTDLLSWVIALAGGLCLGAAILGRTPYLMLLPAVFILAWNPLADKENRHTIPIGVMLVFVLSAMAVSFPVFYIWKGLVSPHQAVIAEGGIKLWHGVLAFAYAGIIALLLVPQWFTFNKKMGIALACLLVVCFVLNVLWWDVAYWPLYDFLHKILPSELLWFYLKICSPLLMVFAAYFIMNLVMHMWAHRKDSYYLTVATGMVFVLLTCVNIKHLFSSRYVAQAAPLLIILLAEKDSIGNYKIVRLLVGIVIGYISLHTYL